MIGESETFVPLALSNITKSISQTRSDAKKSPSLISPSLVSPSLISPSITSQKKSQMNIIEEKPPSKERSIGNIQSIPTLRSDNPVIRPQTNEANSKLSTPNQSIYQKPRTYERMPSGNMSTSEKQTDPKLTSGYGSNFGAGVGVGAGNQSVRSNTGISSGIDYQRLSASNKNYVASESNSTYGVNKTYETTGNVTDYGKSSLDYGTRETNKYGLINPKTSNSSNNSLSNPVKKSEVTKNSGTSGFMSEYGSGSSGSSGSSGIGGIGGGGLSSGTSGTIPKPVGSSYVPSSQSQASQRPGTGSSNRPGTTNSKGGKK